MQLTVTQEAAALEALRACTVQPEKPSDLLSPKRLQELELISRKALPEGLPDDTIVSSLEAVAKREDVPAEARVNAVGLLLFVNSKKGQEYGVSFLKHGDLKFKRLLLLTLNVRDSETPLPITDPALVRELHALIRTPELGHEAMYLCVNSQVPGTLEEIWRCVPDAPAELKAEMAFWLTRLTLDRRTFDLCSQGLTVPDKDAHRRYLTAMEQFVEGKDQGLAQEALEVLATDLLRTLEQKARNLLDFPQGTCMTVLQKGKGPLAKKVVDRILAEPPERDSCLYQKAYSAKRLEEGARGVDQILKDMGDAKRKKWALEAINERFQNSGNPRMADALWRQVQVAKSPQEILLLGRTLFAVGGQEATERCKALADRLPDTFRQDLMLEITKDEPLVLANRFMAAGFLPSNRLESVLSAIKAYQKEYYGEERAPKMHAQEFLTAAKMVAFFDVETDQLPVRHDQLILSLASSSGGVFNPTCCREVFLKDGAQKDSPDRPYQVEFIHHERLYRFVARNFGDWYDLDRVLVACNKALEDSGVPQRFKNLTGDGQCASVACVTPEQERVLRNDFYIGFEKEPNAALSGGKAYEAEVKERLRGH